MITPREIVLLIFLLQVLAFLGITIRRVYTLSPELKEVKQALKAQSTKLLMKSQNQQDA